MADKLINMKKFILLSLIAVSFSTMAQITLIPDTNFERLLVIHGFDSMPLNGWVNTSAIDTITTLDLSTQSSFLVHDLTGIEDFAALESIYGNASIDSLNFSHNSLLKRIFIENGMPSLSYINLNGAVALETFVITGTSLTSIDVSHNPNLRIFGGDYGDFTSLDFSHNPALEQLSCGSCPLTSINLSVATSLTDLRLSNTSLTELNISHLTSLSIFFCQESMLNCLNLKNGNNYSLTMNTEYSPHLFCIEVDDSLWSATYWTGDVDPFTSFSENCNNACSGATAIEDVNLKKRELISVTDLLGRPSTVVPDKVLIYRYSDGTTEKKVIFDF